MPRPSHPLKQRRQTLAAADAHGLQPVTHLPPVHLAQYSVGRKSEAPSAIFSFNFVLSFRYKIKPSLNNKRI
jgi:hypothetical protein